MAFDQNNLYTPSHKTWDHVGNTQPNVVSSEGIRPAGKFKPAAWLPVQFYDKHFEEWFVVMAGKIVACDNNGDLVPAQYGLNAATITYTADDVTAGVTDVRTGVDLLIGDIGTFNVSAVTSFLGTGVALAVSYPLGVAEYAYFQWAGGDGTNPAQFRKHNHILQHATAVLCDAALVLPLVPASTSAEALTFAAPVAGVSSAAAVSNLPVAKNTTRTPFAFTGTSAAGLFIREVETLALVTSPGDYFVNLTSGVVSVWTGSITPVGISLAYYNYASAPAAVSKFACAVGDLAPGAFVKCDPNSNFIVATTEDFKDILGQVLTRESGEPKDFLGHVRSAYGSGLNTNAAGSLPGYAGQMDQMPGSANGGYPLNIHYAGAADTQVRINLISR